MRVALSFGSVKRAGRRASSPGAGAWDESGAIEWRETRLDEEGEEALDFFFGVVEVRGQAHEIIAHGNDDVMLP